MSGAAEPKRQRPTQAERSDAMRSRLLAATLELVSQEGWAQVSTQRICARAGVSRGAQTHHFPTKNDLLIAAVREIVARYQKQMEDALARGESSETTLEYLFDFFWDACFEGQLLECWLEAMVAARTDSGLRETVQRTDARSLASMKALGEGCARSEPAPGADVADIIELTVYLLRGMVVQHGVHPDDGERRRLFEVWKGLMVGS